MPSFVGLEGALARGVTAPAAAAGGVAGQQAGGRFRRRFSRAADVGKAMKAAMPVAAVAAAATALYKVGSTFDDVRLTIIKDTNASGKHLAKMQGFAEKIATTYPVSFHDAAGAVGELNAISGITGQNLKKTAGVVSEVSRITGTDATQNATAFAQSLKSWNVPAARSAAEMKKVFRASQISGMGVGQLLKQFNQFSPILQAAGLSMNQSLGLFAALGKAGIEPRRVIRGLSSAFKKWSADGKNVQSMLGKTVAKIKNAKSPTDALKIATDAFGASAGTQLAQAIRSGALPSLGGLAKTLKGSNGAFKNASKGTTGFGEQMTLLKNKVEEALKPLALGFFDVLTKIAGFVNTTVLPAIGAMAGFVKRNADAFKAAGIVIGIAALAFGIYKGAMLATRVPMAIVLISQRLLNRAMEANPIGLVVAALAALAFALVYAWKHSATFRRIVKGAFDAVKTAAMFLWHGIQTAFNAVKNVIGVVVGFIKRHFQTLLLFLGPAGLIAAGVITLYRHWSQIWGAIKAVFTAVWNGIKRVAMFVWNAIKTYFVTAFRTYKAIFLAVWNAVRRIFSGVWNGIKRVAVGVWNAISGFFRRAFAVYKAAFLAIWHAIRRIFTAVWHGIKRAAVSIWHAIAGFFTRAFNTYRAAFSRIWHAIKRVFTGVWHGIRNTAVGLWNSISGFFTGAFHRFESFFTGVWDRVRNKFRRTWDSIKNIAKSAWNGVKRVFAGGVNVVIDGINWFIGGLDHLPGVNIKKLGHVHFAQGGVVPGYAPGRDTVSAKLSPGESVLRPEVTRSLGPATINRWNSQRRATGFAQGGVVGRDGIPHFGLGGIIGSGWDWIKHKAGQAKNAAFGLLARGAGWLFNHAVKPAANWAKGHLMPPGIVGRIGKGTIDMSLAGIEKLLKKAEQMGLAAPAGAGVQRWAGQLRRALAMNGLPTSPTYVNAWLRQIATESGGNPRIHQQIRDINSIRGHPAQGLLQTIPSTFAANAFPGHHNILNGFDNMLAAIHYAKGRYGARGMLGVIGHGHGYRGGTRNATAGWHKVGEDGPEWLRFRGGEQVMSNRASQRAVGGISDRDARRIGKALAAELAPMRPLSFTLNNPTEASVGEFAEDVMFAVRHESKAAR